jgi:hypothetical protein
MNKIYQKTKYMLVFVLALVFILSSFVPAAADLPIPPEVEPIVEVPWVTPENGFDWYVPSRFGNDRNNDGMVDFNYIQTEKYAVGEYDLTYARPTWFTVYFDGCRTEDESESGISTNTYHWRFLYPGEPEDFSGRDEVGTQCRIEGGFPTQGVVYRVRLTIRHPDGSVFIDSQGQGNPFMQEVVLKDYLIVSIGDSFASGEGNPDIEGKLDYYWYPTPLGAWYWRRDPRWQDARCGRSIWGGPAQAALALERSDRRTSVTFLSFACSGATIDTPFWKDNDKNKPIGTGILGPYRGSELPENWAYDESLYIPSQIEQVRTTVGNRPIDALIISGGGNDIRFGTVVENCVVFPNCWIWTSGREHPDGPEYPLHELVARALQDLPGKFDQLANEINTKLNAVNIFITEYPDLTPSNTPNATNEIDRYCSLVGDIIPGLEVSREEAKSAVELALDPLNVQVGAAAARHGWVLVNGIAAQFRGSLDGRGHGYCASDSWIRNATDSFWMQGPFLDHVYYVPVSFAKKVTKGTLHPNARGHQVYAQRLREEMLPRLNPGAPGAQPPVFNVSLTSGTSTSRQGQNGWLTGRCVGSSCTSDQAVLKVEAAAQGGAVLRGAQVAVNGVNGCSGVPGISCTTSTGSGPHLYSWSFTINQTGIYRLEFQARDNNHQTTTYAYEAKVDLFDPLAGAVIPEESPFHAGWYTAPVQITLTANDFPGLSGPASVQYNLNGTAGEDVPGATLSVETNGYHSLQYKAVDQAGRQSVLHTLNFQIDQTAPSTTAAAAGGYVSGTWTNSNVELTLNAVDNLDGSGVAALTYSAAGAQPINYTTAGAHPVELLISAAGETTITYFAEDEAGNVEPLQFFTVRIDRTAPVLSCGAADGAWHASDVSISCSASDSGSGFAGGPTTAFNLTTNVAAGTETSSASTNSQQVCDLAGNCVTAGPIGGNKVDKKGPVINVASPSAASYLLNEVVASSYGCDDQGSGLANCSGTVAAGSQIDTASPGVKVFQVDASDWVGNTSVQAVNYNVTYKLGLLYEPDKSYKKGSTVPIRLQLLDAADVNLSDASIILNSVDLVKIDNSASSDVASSGNANPDNNFRYDSDLQGYIYNLSTKALSTGTWALKFTVTGDPVTHTITFDVK